jgi:hypothetical protein
MILQIVLAVYIIVQGWRMAFLYNLPMLVIIPTGGSVLPA